jgi:ribosome-associated toxin RatA of RatAB toxin-antitoxin module
MKSIEKSVLIWYSPREMFELVADVPKYPEFLPWCASAEVLDDHANGVTARIGMRLGLVQQSFVTRNTFEKPAAAHAAHAMHLALVDGPFSALDGHWRFAPVGKSPKPADRACRVSLQLQYAFASAALSGVMSHMFDAVASGLVDAFVARANRVYGDGG